MLGDGDFSLLPAPDAPLRILTLGVLIVSGGVLAALPFRRYQAIPDSSSAPAQVTGPTQGILEQSVLESNASRALAAEHRDESVRDDAAPNDPGLFVPSYRSPFLADRLQIDHNPQRANIPLTFEDLQVPLDLPDPVKRRFSATSPIRALQMEQDRTTEIVMPDLESLAESQIQEIKNVAARFAESNPRTPQRAEPTPHVSGTLASSRPTTLGPLPKETDSNRPRHWIRQPD